MPIQCCCSDSVPHPAAWGDEISSGIFSNFVDFDTVLAIHYKKSTFYGPQPNNLASFAETLCGTATWYSPVTLIHYLLEAHLAKDAKIFAFVFVSAAKASLFDPFLWLFLLVPSLLVALHLHCHYSFPILFASPNGQNVAWPVTTSPWPLTEQTQ